jgi:hypothetical protein
VFFVLVLSIALLAVPSYQPVVAHSTIGNSCMYWIVLKFHSPNMLQPDVVRVLLQWNIKFVRSFMYRVMKQATKRQHIHLIADNIIWTKLSLHNNMAPSSHDPVIIMFHCLFIAMKIPLFPMPSSQALFWHTVCTIVRAYTVWRQTTEANLINQYISWLPLTLTVDVNPGTRMEWQYLQIVRLIDGSLLTK